MIVGIDGCREGWIAAILEHGVTSLHVLPSLEGLLEDPALIAAIIDVLGTKIQPSGQRLGLWPTGGSISPCLASAFRPASARAAQAAIAGPIR